MIAKRAPREKASSSFARLAEYVAEEIQSRPGDDAQASAPTADSILDAEHGGERVGAVRVTNCVSDEPGLRRQGNPQDPGAQPPLQDRQDLPSCGVVSAGRAADARAAARHRGQPLRRDRSGRPPATVGCPSGHHLPACSHRDQQSPPENLPQRRAPLRQAQADAGLRRAGDQTRADPRQPRRRPSQGLRSGGRRRQRRFPPLDQRARRRGSGRLPERRPWLAGAARDFGRMQPGDPPARRGPGHRRARRQADGQGVERRPGPVDESADRPMGRLRSAHRNGRADCSQTPLWRSRSHRRRALRRNTSASARRRQRRAKPRSPNCGPDTRHTPRTCAPGTANAARRCRTIRRCGARPNARPAKSWSPAAGKTSSVAASAKRSRPARSNALI